MDDKNKEIDFTNQPLGLMAQEGEKIENELNSEFQKNEEARKNKANVQENPFADLASAKAETPSTPKQPMQATPEPPPPPFNRVPKALEDQVTKPTTTPQQQPVQKKEEPAPAAPAAEPVQQVPISQPNEQRQQEINAYLSKGKKTNGDIQDQPGSWGIIVFIILVAIVGAAVYLFKSGKLDELVGNDDEEQVEKVKEEEPVEEPTKIDGHVVETIKNFRVKETIYIADSTSVTYMNEGVIDLTTMAGKFKTTVHVTGMSSKSINQYCDYSQNICYLDDPENRSSWHIEKLNTGMLGPDEIYEFIKSIGTGNIIAEKNYEKDGVKETYVTYETNITGDDVFKIIEPNEYLSANKLRNSTLKVEYDIVNYRLRRIKIDVSSVLGVSEAFIAEEFADINKNDSIVIPKEIIEKAT